MREETAYKFIVNQIPPSNNQFMGRGSRKHQAYAYQAIKKEWAWLIKEAVGRDGPKEPLVKSRLRLTYFFPTRHRRDPDNYSGKFILDGLVLAQVIEDDSFSNIRLELVGKHDKENPRVEIEVEER